MLIPPPEADLNESLLVRGADILAFLKKQDGEVVIEEVMLDFLKQHGPMFAVRRAAWFVGPAHGLNIVQ